MTIFNKSIALKKMNTDKFIPGMISHQTVSEVMMLKKFNHKNVCTARNIHYNHHLNDLSQFQEDKKDIKLYIEMDKACNDLGNL